MNLSRRGFLTGMLALGAAPAIVRAASLMKVVTPSGLLVPDDNILTLDKIHRTRDLMIHGVIEDRIHLVLAMFAGGSIKRYG